MFQRRFYSGDKVIAKDFPRLCAPSDCEPARDLLHWRDEAVIVDAYAKMIRVKWVSTGEVENGWRRSEDFDLLPENA